MSIFKTPVYPIPPFFNSAGELSTNNIIKYINYLIDNGSKAFMITVGSSGFNLLSEDEISLFTRVVDDAVGKNPLVVGLPIAGIRENKDFLSRLSIDADNRYFMAVYPDRYYEGGEVVDYFYDLTSLCENVFVHGLHIRNGIGGGYRDYDGELISRILDKCDGVVGMKEECSALEKAEDLCAEARRHRNNFELVVAGGSAKRFMYAHQFGATNFLAGLGSLFPRYDNDFFKNIQYNDNYLALKGFVLKEKLLFDITKRAGWHTCMRESISYILGIEYYNRKPFPRLKDKDKKELILLIEELR